MTDPKDHASPSDSVEHVSVAAKEFLMLTMGDIINIQKFFENGGDPDRLSVALYMLAYVVARTVGFSLNLLPVDRSATSKRPATSHWQWKINDQERNRRTCKMHVTIVARQRDSKLPLEIEEIAIHGEPSGSFHARKWNVRFGEYKGVLDLDDPNAINRFCAIAAEEIALSIN